MPKGGPKIGRSEKGVEEHYTYLDKIYVLGSRR